MGFSQQQNKISLGTRLVRVQATTLYLHVLLTLIAYTGRCVRRCVYLCVCWGGGGDGESVQERVHGLGAGWWIGGGGASALFSFYLFICCFVHV